MVNTYYLIENGSKIGPFTFQELTERSISRNTPVLSPLYKHWRNAGKVPELRKYFADYGIYAPGESNHAGFGLRVLSYVLDVLICAFTAVTILTIVDAALVFSGKSIVKADHDGEIDFILVSLLLFVILIIYHALFEASHSQASPGKKMCGIMVTDGGGNRITLNTAIVRNTGKLLSGFLCGTGFLMILWNRSSQGLHDRMAKTYVIRRDK